MFIRTALAPTLISLPPNSLELTVASFKLCNHTLFIGTFYRPPSSSNDISILGSTLSKLPPSLLANLTLVGDFNVHCVSSSTSPLYSELRSVENSYSLHQHISTPTHFSLNGYPSIIDLIFTPSTFPTSHIILPPVSTSDHNAILSFISLPSSTSITPKHLHHH